MTKKTTGERVAVIETKITGIEDSLIEHKNEQRQDFDKLFDKIDNLDKKFAPRFTLPLAVGSFLTALGIITTLIISVVI